MKKILFLSFVSFVGVIILINKCLAVNECCGFISINNPFACGPHSAGYGNCTWWCAYKRPEVINICQGNASQWFTEAQNGGLPVGQCPTIGSIAVFHYWTVVDGVYQDIGHVAYVEKVNNDGSFDVSEMGWNAWSCVHKGTYNRNSFDGLIGFIFPADTATYFTFPNHSSQGWTCGYDTEIVDQTQADQNTWMIAAAGNNPGVVSPSFAKGINTNQFKTLKFSARVDGTGPNSPGYVWLKDSSGNWNHGIYFGNVPRDYRPFAK